MLEKNKQKSEKTVRISDGSQDNNCNNFSIRSEIDDIKRILKSLNGRYRDQQSSGGYTRNFRQNFPHRDDFDGRNRYPRNDFRDRVPKTYNPNHYRQQTNHIQQRGANWFENNTRGNRNGENSNFQKGFPSPMISDRPVPSSSFTPMSLHKNGTTNQVSDQNMDKSIRTRVSPRESVRIEELSDFTKATTN